MPSIMGLSGPGWSSSWEDRAGFGVLLLTAAIVAPLLYRGRVGYESVLCLVLLLFSMGGAALVQWLPGFRMFQIPVRMLMLLALPVALLAGHTTQALLADAERGLDDRRTLLRFLRPVFLAVAVVYVNVALLEFYATPRP